MDRKSSEEQFVCFNIRDFLNPEESNGIGENDLEMILSNFFNPKNSDVESFLKRNAVEFTKIEPLRSNCRQLYSICISDSSVRKKL